MLRLRALLVLEEDPRLLLLDVLLVVRRCDSPSGSGGDWEDTATRADILNPDPDRTIGSGDVEHR